MSPPRAPSVLRPRDADALRAELRRISAISAVPLVFGGEVLDGTLVLTEFVGARTAGLRGLTVSPNAGLGGATIASARPMSIADYRTATTITHHYDGPVLSEGIRSIVAAPVVVDGTARAVIYGAHRAAAPIGERTTDLLVQSARRLSAELAIRDEVDRRMRMQEAIADRTTSVAQTEELREIHAELRRLATRDGTPELRELADRLAAVSFGGPPDASVSLAPREVDVLSLVALGCTNAEAAHRLSLRTETVKAYLRSAAVKLGAHTRHEAVNKARKAGLLA